MEAELIASSNAVQKGVWLSRFLHNLGVVTSSTKQVTIYCDNEAAIAYTKDILNITTKPNTLILNAIFERDIIQHVGIISGKSSICNSVETGNF